jgi:hypothetical protein
MTAVERFLERLEKALGLLATDEEPDGLVRL